MAVRDFPPLRLKCARQFLEGLSYPARTGVPRRDLPSEFGAWDAA